MKYKSFARTWRSADNWGLVILRPGALPASRDHHAYASAVASLETMQHHESARVAYQAGLQRWDDNAVLMLGYANALHGLNDLHSAVGAYRRVLSKYPRNIPAANNLAQTLGELGCKDEALEVVEGISPAAAKSKFAAALATTQSSLIEAERTTCRPTEFGTHKRTGVIAELSGR